MTFHGWLMRSAPMANCTKSACHHHKWHWHYNCLCLNLLQAGVPLDMSTLEARMKCAACKLGHPVIIQQDGHESAFTVFCDGHVIPCGHSINEAFDFFKFIWIFNLQYTCGLKNFLKFFEFKIYRLSISGRAPPTVNEIARLLIH